MVRRRITNKKGFTLVELMTTVAIVGTLAAVGVPQYRKFQRKAKRSEAQMLFGVIGVAEASFSSEYGVYGNNLPGIGVELDSRPAVYQAGFTKSDCTALPTAILPAAADISTFPNYKDTGWSNFGTLGTTSSTSPAYLVGPSSKPANCGVAADVSGSASYRVGAGGAIGGLNPDQLTMDQTRAVSITTDGTI